MGAPLPDWDRVCRRIVDGDKQVKRCSKILREETSGVARQLEAAESPDEKVPWYRRLLEGESGTWVTLAIPVVALGVYMVLNRPKAPALPAQVATAT